MGLIWKRICAGVELCVSTPATYGMDYLKYYSLEKYLFGEEGKTGEIRSKFLEQHNLSAEDFFCIIIWKTNRSRTKIKETISNLKIGKTLEDKIKRITTAVYEAGLNDKTGNLRMKTLLHNKDWKFYLPTASAILTVLYPEEFSVYDFRVREQLGIKKEITGIKRYFEEFLPNVIPVAEKVSGIKKLALRDADRILWGKSFYDDLVEFLK